MKKIYLLVTMVLIVAFATAQVNLSKGLMAYYPFTGNANDSSGNSNNPSFNNATLTADRFGNANSAYYFDGQSSYIEVPNSASLNAGNTITISAWVKPMGFYAGPCQNNFIMQKGSSTDILGYGLEFSSQGYSNGGTCSLPLDTIHQDFYGPTAYANNYSYQPYIQENNWYHVVYSYNGDSTHLYVNNVLKFTTKETFSAFANSSPLFLGKHSSDATYPYWFNGVLDDIRIYNRALDSSEVTALYTALNPDKDTIPTCDSSLVMYGSPTNKAFQTSSFLNDPNAGPHGDTSGTELYAFAWTATSIGIPDYNGRSLIKYDLSQLPSNAIVKSAKLYLYAKLKNLNGVSGSPTYGTNNIGLLQKVYSHWKMDSTNYFTPLVVDTATEVILPKSTNTTENYIADITAYAQNWVSKPDSNNGMLFRLQTENDPYNSLIFESGLASDTTKRPRLEICYSLPAMVPGTVQSFTANAITVHYIGIRFSIENETNAIAIEVDRSLDSTNFIPINLLTVKGSVGLNQYNFTDKVSTDSAKAYYRLKIVNKDGSSQYSKTIGVQLDANNDQFSVYPNPAKKFIMVNGKKVTEVDIYDKMGNLVFVKKNLNTSSTLNKIKFNLSPGVYIAQLQIVGGKLVNEKIVVE